jgi:hypothetical protein
MIPFVLPNMMMIAEQASDTEYLKIVFPAFIPLFKIMEPLQVVYFVSYRISFWTNVDCYLYIIQHPTSLAMEKRHLA